MATNTAISPSIMMPPETRSSRASLRRSRSAAGSSGPSLSSDVIAEAIEKAAFRVEADQAGMRLDAFLAGRDKRLSRSRIKALIKAGGTRLAGLTVADPAHRLAEGDLVEFVVPPAEAAEPEPEAIPLTVVFEDDDVIVIDKPAGLV